MLNELFSWIHSDGDSTLLSNEMVTKSTLKSTHKIAVDLQRKMVADIRLERLVKSKDPSELRDKSLLIDSNQAYIKFLEFSQEKLTLRDPYPSFDLGLDYCLERNTDDPGNNEKIAKIFFAMLEDNPDKALEVYQEKKKELDEIISIKFRVKIERVTQSLLVLSEQLKFQKKPLGLVPLFKNHIENPEEFAVILLWMLQQGVSVENILKNYFLHNFLSYHLISLHDSESPIDSLYAILEQFPQARPLLEAAGKVRCEERGFNSYALTGKVCLPDSLRSVEETSFSFDFSSTKENFSSLHKLYGQPLLVSALLWCADSDESAEWKVAIHQVINDSLTLDQLSSLINYFSTLNNSKLFELLSSLIDGKSVGKLVEMNHGSVLHLLPYKESLYRKISDINVAQFLKQFNASSISDYDAVPQLMSMFNVFRVVNEEIASLVYEAVLERMLQTPMFFDDSQLVKKLKKFADRDTLLNKKITEFETQLDHCILQQSLAESFTIDGYHAIEDVWLGMAQKIVYLKEISPLESSCPHDKHALRARIAKEYFEYHKHNFDLNSFVLALEIEPVLAEESVTDYERVLIELITSIDDNSVRNNILKILEKKYDDSSHWVHKKYGGETVFNLAAKQGNVGFLTWLEDTNPTTRVAVGYATLHAAKAKQWRVVDYFCTVAETRPRQHVVDEALEMAAADGALETVRLICESEHTPVKKAVEQAVLKAVMNNQVSVAGYLCNLPSKNAPCHAILVKGFKVAFHDGNMELLQVLGSVPNPLLTTAVEHALASAVSRGDLASAKVLCGLEENTPRTAALEKALETAISKGDLALTCYLATLVDQKAINFGLIDATARGHTAIAQALCNLPKNAPSQKAIEVSLDKAIRIQSLPLMKFFCGLKKNAPRPTAVEESMQVSAKLGYLDGLRYLCTESPIKLRPSALEQAMVSAAGNKQDAVVDYVGRSYKPSGRMVDQALHAAVKGGHTSTVKLISDLPTPPSKSANRIALKKARSLGHEDIAKLLRGSISSVVTPGSTGKEEFSKEELSTVGKNGFFYKKVFPKKVNHVVSSLDMVI
jgi:hypothetical protein